MTQTEQNTDPCVWCGHPTALGHGRFVNRIPAVTDDADGYACAECAGYECDECGEQIYLDHEVRVDFTDPLTGLYRYGNYHERCYTAEIHGPAAY